MAISKGKMIAEKPAEELDDSAYLSDESDFYGDAATKSYFETRANSFNAKSWWKEKVPSLTEIANTNMATMKEVKTAKLYNIYEGLFYARQLSESVEEFLQRLPPATSEYSIDLLPWIFITNPYIPRALGEERNEEELKHEGPPEEKEDRAQFVMLGETLLQELEEMKSEIEKELEGKATMSISRAVNKERDVIVKKIQQTAVDMHCTSGKWMLFIDAQHVNAVWSIVARATASNDLGTAAKVAPYDAAKTRTPRLICIYTKDFKDTEDIARVVRKMKDLGLVKANGKPIYYKCDAYTHLGLNSGNSYNIKPSIYSSNDFLQPKNQKIDEHFKRKLGDMLE